MEITVANNIHNLLKDYYQNNGKTLNEEKTQELGVNLAKEISQLPLKEHILAWNIIGDSFDLQFGDEKINGQKLSTEIAKSLASGALTILNTSIDRENFISGFTLHSKDENFVSKKPMATNNAPKPRYPEGFDINNLDIDKEISTNIRQILNDFHQSNPDYSNKEQFQKLGVTFAKEIAKLPESQHMSAWNIIADSFESELEAKKDKINNKVDACTEIGIGAVTVLSTENDRDNFIKGISFYNLFMPNKVSKVNKPK